MGLDDKGERVSVEQEPKFARCKLCDTGKPIENAIKMARFLNEKHKIDAEGVF